MSSGCELYHVILSDRCPHMLGTKGNVGLLLSSISEAIHSNVKFLIASGEEFVVIDD